MYGCHLIFLGDMFYATLRLRTTFVVHISFVYRSTSLFGSDAVATHELFRELLAFCFVAYQSEQLYGLLLLSYFAPKNSVGSSHPLVQSLIPPFGSGIQTRSELVPSRFPLVSGKSL